MCQFVAAKALVESEAAKKDRERVLGGQHLKDIEFVAVALQERGKRFVSLKITEREGTMKKTILVVLVLLIVPAVIYAQPGIGIGVKGGVNIATQSIPEIDIDPDTITDFHVGGYVNLNFTKHIGITPEVLFTAHGSSIENTKINTDYIAIPIMLRVKPVSLISLEAGPQFSFLTNSDVEGFGDFMDYLKTNDFGLAFGGGVHLPLGFQVGARYVLGFTNIMDVSFEGVDDIKNRTFQIYAGWTFLGAK